MVPVVILHCPALGRDLAPLLAAVPHASIEIGPRTGHDGCNAGHQAIVARARAQGWRSVTVLEDDCVFTPAWSWAQWVADIKWAAQHQYTMLVGGSVSTARPRLVREGLVAVDRFKSTHCITYLRDAYDVVARVQHGPIDKQLGRLGGRPLVTCPFVAVQRPGFSGTLDVDVDYLDAYARHETQLRHLTERAA